MMNFIEWLWLALMVKSERDAVKAPVVGCDVEFADDVRTSTSQNS